MAHSSANRTRNDGFIVEGVLGVGQQWILGAMHLHARLRARKSYAAWLLVHVLQHW